MKLKQLSVNNLRAFDQAAFDFHPEFTLHLHRRIWKHQAGRGPDTHAAEGIRSPGHQSDEHVPSGWQVGTGESLS